MVCNADEGDPGAFMDRAILDGDPHSVVEGMLIAGYAIGATTGYIYIRAEYPVAVERMENAINQARAYGLLGKNIFDSGFDYDLEIRMGAGVYVCGEETALMASIEGKRGEPRQKPPLPFQKGLYGYPTNINNVETLANVGAIIKNGGKWYAQYGTADSKGTKVFALAGDVEMTGIVEVPIGTPAAGDHLRYRRRRTRRQKVQGRADRRALGRLCHRRGSGYAYRLQTPAGAGRDRRLRHPDRDERGHLHGGQCPLLHGIHP